MSVQLEIHDIDLTIPHERQAACLEAVNKLVSYATRYDDLADALRDEWDLVGEVMPDRSLRVCGFAGERDHAHDELFAALAPFVTADSVIECEWDNGPCRYTFQSGKAYCAAGKLVYASPGARERRLIAALESLMGYAGADFWPSWREAVHEAAAAIAEFER